jgi:hypothetical protein
MNTHTRDDLRMMAARGRMRVQWMRLADRVEPDSDGTSDFQFELSHKLLGRGALSLRSSRVENLSLLAFIAGALTSATLFFDHRWY